MISLVPMAGAGNRFVKEGYRLSKPFIPISGLPMFVACLGSLPRAEKYVFVCRSEFLEKFPFEKETGKYFPGSSILSVDKGTEGQACTCLVAEDSLDPDGELLISSIDYQLVYDEAAFREMRGDGAADVIVFTFRIGAVSVKDPDAFAYCRTENGKVTEIIEKRTISDTPENDPAVTGTFYYRRAADFVRGANAMIDRDIRVNNEFYVGTSINQLIEKGADVRTLPVDKFISFGDPLELQIYQAWEEFFYNEESHPYSGWE